MKSREDRRDDEWLDNMRAHRAKIRKLPKCSECGRRIQSDYQDEYLYRIDETTLLCQSCLDDWLEAIKEVAPYDMG